MSENGYGSSDPQAAEAETRARHLELIATGMEAGQRPLNPFHEPVLRGEYQDPSARAGANVSAEVRTLESVLAVYTIEGLLVMLTPRDMVLLVDTLLATLCIPALVASDADESALLSRLRSDPEVPGFFERHGEELQRALWHVQGILRAEGVA